MSDSTNFLVERDGHVATVTIDMADTLNALNDALILEFAALLAETATDRDIRAIILTGAGRAFSAGGDLQNMADMHGTAEGLAHTMRQPEVARRLIETFYSIETPIIGAINGDAIGLGATLAVMCDTAVIAEDAKFGDTHVRVGLVAGDGGAALWPILIGANKAKDLLMRALVFSGSEAVEHGLVNYAAPREEVMAEARKIADGIAKLPPLAVRWTKASVNKGIKAQINTVFDASIAYEAMTMVSADHGEAARAFLEKRKPSFEGR